MFQTPFIHDYLDRIGRIETFITDRSLSERPNYDFIRTILQENEPSDFHIYYMRTIHKLKIGFLHTKNWILEKIQNVWSMVWSMLPKLNQFSE